LAINHKQKAAFLDNKRLEKKFTNSALKMFVVGKEIHKRIGEFELRKCSSSVQMQRRNFLQEIYKQRALILREKGERKSSESQLKKFSCRETNFLLTFITKS